MTASTDRLDALKAGTATPPPIVQTMGLGLLDDWGEGWVRKMWIPKPELKASDGAMFGGYIAALADQVLGFAAMTVIEDGMAFRTINLQVNFARVAAAQPIKIEASVVSRTRQLMTVRATLRREDGDLIAEATAQQLVMPLDQASFRD
jgi:uncharacterized protein (TIGR00369 family)